MVKTHNSGQRGQVGLIVLLVGAVLMTIGLGVASQSVMEINTASLETDSSQAFNAAEQGVESALQNLTSDDKNISGYNVNVLVTPQRDKYEGTILEGHSAQLDMTGVNSLNLTWSDSGPGCGVGRAAIVVTYISSGGLSLTREAYGRNCGGDNFIQPDSCDDMSCTVTPTLGVGLGYVRIKAVYSDTQLTVGISGGVNPQYYEITSTATGENSPEARSVQVSKSVASAPSIFDYALFSGADLATSP